MNVSPGFLEWGYAGLSIVGTVAIIMMMRIGKKLAAFDAEEKKSGEVIRLIFRQIVRPKHRLTINPVFVKPHKA